MGLFSNLFATKEPVQYKELVEKGAVIIDVRTPGEFASGHIPGSINIPLDQIPAEVDTIRKKHPVVITCCRSGNRSAVAKQYLDSNTCTAINGGAWNALMNQLK
ncbi:MAG TPA: rhodanese-like domain-containing protein [Ferruginibacter sp.]|nr:rhodanese-like domain-containing protein [Ferruginibacter sp.]HRN79736.1 rhodanese-like domain-containing protein [Ferruginibacter sp.]HRO17544.1 rhodanese-like domain-containing protein [Ferruginibacter sp.]HRQ20691.1 rhodanese-like domain-containing protein [Ferruginibacter sp.]